MEMPEGYRKILAANKYGGLGVMFSYEGTNIVLDLMKEMAEALAEYTCEDTTNCAAHGASCRALKKFKEWK
jgi:hypothetical protein